MIDKFMEEQSVADGHKRRLKNIEESFQWFKDNYQNYVLDRYFLYVSTLTQDQIQANTALAIPLLEFNVALPHISNLLGEFSRNYPGIEISAQEGALVEPQLIEIIEGIVNKIIYKSYGAQVEYEVFQEAITGGFSAFMPEVDFEGDMTFDQEVLINKLFDPTLCFWDFAAKTKTKTDGKYCGYLVPMRIEDFEREFGEYIESPNTGSYVGSFRWQYTNTTEKTIMVAYYFERESLIESIVMLSNGQTMKKKEYTKLVKEHKKGVRIGLVPEIVKERDQEFSKIIRRTLCQAKELAKEDTLYTELPIIYVDGDSHFIKDPGASNVRQVTSSIIRQVKDAVRFKTVAGQMLAHEIQRLSHAYFMYPEEAISSDNAQAWKNPQMNQSLPYKMFKDDNPSVPLNKPDVVFRQQIPPELLQAFMAADNSISSIMGGYDPAMAKIAEKNISGRAIEKAQMKANASAMPFLVSFEHSMQKLAEMILDLIPQIYMRPRLIQIRSREGKERTVYINGEQPLEHNGKRYEPIRLKFKKGELGIKVKAGPNFEQQQHQALEDIIGLMNINNSFGEVLSQLFISEGMEFVLDNMTFRGVDQLKSKVEQFVAKMEQDKQQQQELMAKQPNPETMKLQLMQEQFKYQQEQQQVRNKMDALEHLLDKQRLKLEAFEVLADLKKAQSDESIATTRARAEIGAKAMDMAMEIDKFAHQRDRDIIGDIKEMSNRSNEVYEPSKRKIKARAIPQDGNEEYATSNLIASAVDEVLRKSGIMEE